MRLPGKFPRLSTRLTLAYLAAALVPFATAYFVYQVRYLASAGREVARLDRYGDGLMWCWSSARSYGDDTVPPGG